MINDGKVSTFNGIDLICLLLFFLRSAFIRELNNFCLARKMKLFLSPPPGTHQHESALRWWKGMKGERN